MLVAVGVYVVGVSLLVVGVPNVGTACSCLMFVCCVPVLHIVLLLLFFPSFFSFPVSRFLSLCLILLYEALFLRGSLVLARFGSSLASSCASPLCVVVGLGIPRILVRVTLSTLINAVMTVREHR